MSPDIDTRISRLLNQLDNPMLSKEEVGLIEQKVRILQSQKT